MSAGIDSTGDERMWGEDQDGLPKKVSPMDCGDNVVNVALFAGDHAIAFLIIHSPDYRELAFSLQGDIFRDSLPILLTETIFADRR